MCVCGCGCGLRTVPVQYIKQYDEKCIISHPGDQNYKFDPRARRVQYTYVARGEYALCAHVPSSGVAEPPTTVCSLGAGASSYMFGASEVRADLLTPGR